MDNNLDVKVFDKKSLSDIFKEIHTNQRTKSRQINAVLSDLKPFLKTEDSVISLIPVIKEILDVSVKNDEQLIKMTAVVQRVIAKDAKGGSINDYGLSEDEKEQLLKEAKQIKETDEELNLNESVKNYNRRE
ncbi:hypothetical protein [Microcystis phage Mel-JY01]